MRNSRNHPLKRSKNKHLDQRQSIGNQYYELMKILQEITLNGVKKSFNGDLGNTEEVWVVLK